MQCRLCQSWPRLYRYCVHSRPIPRHLEFERDQYGLDARRLKFFRVDRYHRLYRLANDQVICKFESDVKPSMHADFHKD